jgi:HAD superfamily hydrolase (TIGR01459 family)
MPRELAWQGFTFMKHIQSVSELTDKYDAFILDLWGVIHDGKVAYPGVVECLQKLKDAGKKLILLSNAPRRAKVVVEAMQGMGIGRELYDEILTSGEAAYQVLSKKIHPTNNQQLTTNNLSYLYLGLEKDRQIIKDLGYVEVEDAKQASFALVSHSTYDHQPMEEIQPFLNACSANNLPMICINPDLEVVRQTGERVACAGLIAAEYERMQGQVMYFGKPHKMVYEQCFSMLEGIDRKRVVAVGDSPRTDIAGANRMGIDSMLITGGVLAAEVGTPDNTAYLQKTESVLSQSGTHVKYVCDRFIWS